jgi:hypothetical protein
MFGLAGPGTIVHEKSVLAMANTFVPSSTIAALAAKSALNSSIKSDGVNGDDLDAITTQYHQFISSFIASAIFFRGETSDSLRLGLFHTSTLTIANNTFKDQNRTMSAGRTRRTRSTMPGTMQYEPSARRVNAAQVSISFFFLFFISSSFFFF